MSETKLKFENGKIIFKDKEFPTTKALKAYINKEMGLLKFKNKQKILWEKLQKIKNMF